MKKGKKKLLLVVMVGILAFPFQATAAAAGKTETKEQVFLTGEKDQKGWKKYVSFEESYEKDGKLYQLKAIDYQVLETKYLDTVEKATTGKEPPKETLMEEGVTYTLVSSIPQEVTDGGGQTVTGYTDYGYAVASADVPQTKMVTVTNEATGQPETVRCSFTGLAVSGVETAENQIAITYIGYDADSYSWNGYTIPKNDSYPAVGQYEQALLDSVGAEAGSRITSVAWTGGEYVVDGTVYRDAVATVQQQRTVYRANYVGSIGGKTVTVYRATYRGKDPKGDRNYTVKATATYRVVKRFTTVQKVVAIGVALLILIGCIVGILFLMRRKKERKMEVI